MKGILSFEGVVQGLDWIGLYCCLRMRNPAKRIVNRSGPLSKQKKLLCLEIGRLAMPLIYTTSHYPGMDMGSNHGMDRKVNM